MVRRASPTPRAENEESWAATFFSVTKLAAQKVAPEQQQTLDRKIGMSPSVCRALSALAVSPGASCGMLTHPVGC